MHTPAPRALIALAVAIALGATVVACSNSHQGRASGATTTGPTATARATTTTAVATTGDYVGTTNWLCRPGMANSACDVGLDATLIAADGTRTVQPYVPAIDPNVDCFYAYPTISTDQPPNADRQDVADERVVVRFQFARFGAACRLFAPAYRQVPLKGLAAFGGTTTTRVAGAATSYALAYGDVLDAWRQYLADDNDGRPFVLIGHSQGAGLLSKLVTEQIQNEPALRKRMVSALLIGAGIPAPGSPKAFTDIPPCRTTKGSDKTPVGCVVAYSSFASAAPPPADSYFGKPRQGPGRVICTNPASLAPGPAPLDSYFPATPANGVTTPWVRYQGLVTGDCTRNDQFDWLRITHTQTAGDARPADLGGRISPQWGLHLIDVNLAMGDLVGLVQRQAAQLR